MDDKPAVRGKPDAVLRECEHLTSIVRRRSPIPKSSGMHFKSTGDTPELCVSGTIPPIYVNFRSTDSHACWAVVLELSLVQKFRCFTV